MTEELKEQDIRLNKLCFDYHEKEKRITELETRCNELFFQVNEKIAKITELEAQIEKMKCCQNCSHLCSRCELGIDGCYVCSKWEIKEND